MWEAVVLLRYAAVIAAQHIVEGDVVHGEELPPDGAGPTLRINGLDDAAPEAMRMTNDDGTFKAEATPRHIDKAYEKALAAAELPRDWNGLVDRMRDCLLAKELHPGEEVLFVGTEPYGGPGACELRGGPIRFVAPERKTCTVRGSFFDMKDVPLRYVLGRYNAEITETHYGRPHVEVLFGEYPALAQQYLHEAEERWEQYETDAAAAPTQTM